MLEVKLYKFAKKNKSTKQPTGKAFTLQCTLIEPCDILNPEIILANVGKPTEYNYVEIPEFKRFYFVRNWAYEAGRWRCGLKVDPMASWRSEIGSSSQYVLRAASDFDGKIVDNLYPAKAEMTTAMAAPDSGNPFVGNMKEGTFIVGMINSDSTAVGTVSYYAFTNAQFRTFCNRMLGDLEWAFSGIKEMTSELFRSLFNPFQYVASCIWLPFSGVKGAAISSLPYGWWTFPIECTRITGTIKVLSMSFTVPKHPQAAQRGEYLNAAPYTSYELMIPALGTFPLDSGIMAEVDKLTVDCTVDYVTGTAVLAAYENAGNVLWTRQVNVGVNVQLSSMASDVKGAAAGVSTALTGAIRGTATLAVKGVGDFVESLAPQMLSTGSNAFAAGYLYNAYLIARQLTVVDDSPTHNGRPLCKEVTISSLSGYIETQDCELAAPCTSAELAEIVSTMDGGFFYE